MERALRVGCCACLVVAMAACGKKAAAPGAAPHTLSPLPPPPTLELTPESTASSTGPLAVVAARPQGAARGEVRPTVTFNKPVKALGTLEAQRAQDAATPFAKVEPPIEGEWRWLGSAAAELVPKAPLPYSTSFRVTVLKGLRAADGSVLAEDHSFVFSTPALSMQKALPRPGYRWLVPEATFTLLFDQPIKTADLEAQATLEVEGEATPRSLEVRSRVSLAEESRALEAKQRPRDVPRPSFEEKGFKNQQTRFVLAARAPLPLDRSVTLHLPATLHGEQGVLPMGTPVALSYRTWGRPRVERFSFCSLEAKDQPPCPRGPLLLVTSTPLDLKSVKERLTVRPPVELRWPEGPTLETLPQLYGGQEVLRLEGAFQPGTRYEVTLAPGATDLLGQTLSEPAKASLTTSDLPPAFAAGGSPVVLEAAGGPRLPIEVTNLSSLQVLAWRLSPEELCQQLAQPSWPEGDGPKLPSRAPDLQRTESLALTKNTPTLHPLSFAEALPAAAGGPVLLRLEGEHDEPRRRTQRVLAQLTNLAPHLKLGPISSAAWVTRLSTGEPVGGATLRLRDGQGRVHWSGQTSAEGLAELPGAATLPVVPPYSGSAPFLVLEAAHAGDVAFTASDWNEGIEAWAFSLPQGWEGKVPEPEGFAFTDRGIYRPGDKAYFKGIARYRRLGKLLTPPAGTAVRWSLRNPENEEVSSGSTTLTRFGTFAGEVGLPEKTALGLFSLTAELTLGKGPRLSFYGSFRVEEYRAPQFKVDVGAAAPSVLAGETLQAKVDARYLYGAAMGKTKVRWSVTRAESSFTPAGASDFTFGPSTWWRDDLVPGSSQGFVASGEGVTEADGHLSFQAGAAEAPGGKTWVDTLEAEVEDVSRQRVAGRASVTVHPGRYYVGLRAPSGFAQVGEVTKVEAVVVGIDQKRIAARAFEVELKERVWKSVQRKDASGGFITLSEPVETVLKRCPLVSASDPVRCELTPRTPGFYIATSKVTDEQGRTQSSSVGFYVSGAGWVPWRRDDTDRIELQADRSSYDVGQTARVLIKSPYPQARALVTVEREGVLDKRVLTLQGSSTTVEVPIREAYLPNVFVSVVVVRPRVEEGGIESGADPGRPAARVGLLQLQVERKTRRLSVDVRTDVPQARPGATVTAAVQVKNARGEGAPAEVALMVVDEAVLRLTDYETPDPVAALFPDRPLSVTTAEPLLQLARRRGKAEKGEEAGGGGGRGESSGLRTRFQTTALFLPAVLTDAQGKAEVKVPLPDNLTEFRVMAVAVGEGDTFGAGQTSLLVNKPLLALPSLPRFARLGDVFEAGVALHLKDRPGGEATVRADVKGVELLEPAEKRVSLSPDKPLEVRFKLKASTIGEASLAFRVKAGADDDGVLQKLPVALPVATETVALSGDTRERREEALEPPADVLPEVGGLTVTLASTALGNFEQGLSQLVEYPYGCLEQQASRLIPFVALRELAGVFGTPWPEVARSTQWLAGSASRPTAPDQVIAESLQSIIELQTPEGSFRYWPGSDCSDSWTSAYATLALVRAADVGFEVPAKPRKRALDFLSRVAAGRCAPCERECPAETQVMANYVLARSKQPAPSNYERLFSQRSSLSLFARALLADAMFLGKGDRPQARALLQELLNQARESPQGLHLEEVHSQTYATLFQSDTRSTAALLQTLSDLQPDHPHVGKLAHYLQSVRRKNGQWRSTQEASFALMALTELVRTREKETPAFDAKVTLAGKPVASERFEGRSLQTRAARLSLPELSAQLNGKTGALAFSKAGPGVLSYSAALTYAPKAPPTRALEAGLYVQRWFEPFTGGGQALRFLAGELVRVRVRVASNQERHWVALSVPLPAGLEPVDTSLATTSSAPRSPDEEPLEGGEYESDEDQGDEVPRWAFQFWSPFNQLERRDDRVVVFADHLPPGIHLTSFVARATTPGTFLLPPARGELMYEPEVFGRSEGGTFEVATPPALSGR